MVREHIIDINIAFNENIGGAYGDSVNHFNLDMIDFLNLGDTAITELKKVVKEIKQDDFNVTKAHINLKNIRFLAPIPRPRKNIVCLGLNYADHIKEDSESREGASNVLPEHPVFFTKPPTTVIGPYESIIYPRSTEKLDYEVELALIIGKKGKYIAAEDALSFIAGYTVINDVSARDLQTKHLQWFMGKSCDTFAPMGPYIVTTDEIKDPHNLELFLKVNGETRQQANTQNMIYKIPEIISTLSNGITLEVGDIIATGTPSGVGMAHPKGMLFPGDTVLAKIEKIGTIINKVEKEEI